ncbi:stalk domain-containing protein [Paenibacillus sp. KN14-4R]|uniref:stalk domain-containing protein n=1 Tax=Paenibacillus sp. KN14-4R TaxID=3445773 RepID=UPI003FA12223
MSKRKISTYGFIFCLVLFIVVTWCTDDAKAEKAPLIIDKQLEKVIRKQIYKPTGTLVKADMLKLKVLQVPQNQSVLSLEGLQYATNLRALIIEGNQITSLDPIAKLTKLNSVVLDHNNIIDISPLQGLTNLQYVWIDHNQIKDLTPLTSLKQLAEVSVAGNPLHDASIDLVKAFEEKGMITKYENEESTMELPANGVSMHPLSVYFGDKLIYSGELPEEKSSVVMIPLRPVAEALNMTMDWNQDTQVIKIARERLKINLQIGSSVATMDGREIQLAAAPRLEKGDTLIPLQLIAQTTDHEVSWSEEFRETDIISGYSSYVNEMLHSYFLKYEGATKEGKPHGKGKYMWEDNKVWYEGNFVDGKIQGNGTLYDVYAPGRYYTGGFDQEIPNGDGKIVYEDGSYALVHMQKGKREGLVKSYNANQVLMHEVQYKNDRIDGQGTNYSDDGYKYVGYFKQDGSLTGQGKIFLKDELIYEGNFEDGYSNGIGKIYHTGKLTYEGDFYRDQPFGWGTSYDTQGKVRYVGELVNNYFIGQGTSYMTNGDVYTGEHYMGLPDGKGVLKNAEGKVLQEGDFFAGKYDPDLEKTKLTEAYVIHSLQKKLDYKVNESGDKSDKESEADSVNMYLEFSSEEDLLQFKALSENGKRSLIIAFIHDHWSELSNMKECLTVITFEGRSYASAIVGEKTKPSTMEFEYFPNGH